ncbi:SDR family NAD(P)-dependent oxidoreductase [Caldifermentibacillus hisashii]|uniref:SDR family NAD(P)-dependent oxidoreductase n=1 Tax=Caldifermentibacillus hisashii TaxID=996558 RepID=UPI003368F733
MDLQLNGKNVVVTGGSRGIGKAIVLEFAKEGANVFINYFGDENEAEAVRLEAEKMGVQAISGYFDVSSSLDVEKMYHKVDQYFDQIDVVVNNAGIAYSSPIIEMSDEDWDRMIKVHLYGTFYNAREAVKRMKKLNQGKIINISSDLGSLGCEEYTHYSAAKGGINAFTKALARELAPNILVNAVAPSGTLTSLLEAFGENYVEEESAKYPLKRLAKPEEIAKTVVFLASKHADFYTGQIIGPNGGVVMNG